MVGRWWHPFVIVFLLGTAVGMLLYTLRLHSPWAELAIGISAALVVMSLLVLTLGFCVVAFTMLIDLPSNIRRSVRAARRSRGLCEACGYDFRGGHARCPECGQPTGIWHPPARET
jgi:uncharacterized paraquat-inducible protein A